MTKNKLILDPERGCTKCKNVDGCTLRLGLWGELTKSIGFVSVEKTEPVFIAVGDNCSAFELNDVPI